MVDSKAVNKRDLYSGLILIVFSAVAFFHLIDLPLRAAIFPQVMLGGMFVLSCLLVLKSLRFGWWGKPVPGKGAGAAEKEQAEAGPAPTENRKAVAIILITIFLYILLMPPLGFLLSTILFIFSALYALGLRRYFLMAFLAVVTSSGVFVIFKTVMYISLPGGIFDPTEYLYMLIG